MEIMDSRNVLVLVNVDFNLLILKSVLNKLSSLLTVSDFLFFAAIVMINLHPVRIK